MASRSDSVDVFLRLHGQRKFAKEVDKSAVELEALGVRGARSMARFAASGEKLKKFGRSWTQHVSVPVLGLGVVSGKFAIDFDRAMRNVNSIAQLPEAQLHRLENRVLGLAGPTAQAPKTLAEGLYDIVSSGFNASDGLKVLKASALGASAGLTTTDISTKAVAAALNAYHRPASEAMKVSDTLFETVNRGVVSFPELAQTIGDALPFASQLGISLNEVGASIATLTKQGLSGAEAVTRIKNAYIAFIKPSKPLNEVLNELNTTGEKLISKRGFQGAMEAVVNQTDGSKEAIAALFPNIRGMGALLGLVGTNAKSANEDLDAFQHSAGRTRTALSQQEKSVGFKLQRAWAKFQVTLIRFGDKVLPKALEIFQKFLPYVEQAVDAFASLPLSVQAGIIAFGPLTTAVGFFANGVGRALILMAKLGRLSKDMSIFSSAMQTGQGFSGAKEMAFGGYGKGAALQTAKGFALSLGPAVAAYGIGNIVTSATSGDWEDAGWEAGGALAGGIAGFVVGGPLGAMLGVGIGSLGGELLKGLFTKAPKLSLMRRETEHLTRAFTVYRESISGLKSAEGRESRVHQRHVESIHREREASHALTRVLARYGANSTRATRAQRRLSEAQRAVTRTAKAEQRLHQLTGFRLKAFRIQSLHAVASIKQLLPVQRRRIGAMREEVNHGRTGIKFLNELEGLEKRVGKEKRQLTEIYGEAETKAGKPWAKRLQTLTTLQAKYGAKGHVLVAAAQGARDKLKELTDTGMGQTLMWQEAREELLKYNRTLKRFVELEEGLAPQRLGGSPATPTLQGEHGHRAPGSHAPPASGTGKKKPVSSQRRNVKPETTELLAAGLTIHNHMHTTVEVDRKVLGETTEREASRRARRR